MWVIWKERRFGSRLLALEIAAWREASWVTIGATREADLRRGGSSLEDVMQSAVKGRVTHREFKAPYSTM